MRWIFLLLVLVNVGMFAWQHRLVPKNGGELSLIAVPLIDAPPEKLRLLSEIEKPLAAPARGDTSAVLAVPRCMVLGGFESIARARQLEQRLLSLDIAAKVVAIEATLGADHWVYIPPLASRQATMRQLRELQARGIDSYLITEGELANGILLGVFPRLDAAVLVADKLRVAGYSPQVRELPRIYQEYWVRVAAKDQRLIDEEMLQSLAGDFFDLKHQLISCLGVAHR